MYHDVMNPKPSMGYHPNSKCKKPINHEIQLLFKYENLLLCVCVGGGCVCVRMKYFPGPEQSFIYLFIYLGFLYSG